jgi:hypothetical protein
LFGISAVIQPGGELAIVLTLVMAVRDGCTPCTRWLLVWAESWAKKREATVALG